MAGNIVISEADAFMYVVLCKALCGISWYRRVFDAAHEVSQTQCSL